MEDEAERLRGAGEPGFSMKWVNACLHPEREPMPYHLKDPKTRHPEVEAHLQALEGTAGEAARWLAELARATIPGCVEGLYHRMPSFALANGAIVCHVSGFTRHASIGFGRGNLLTDPDGLLEGSGKGHRMVKLSAPGSVPASQIEALIVQAVELAAD